MLSPSRNTRQRNPSHLGSYIHAPSGMVWESLHSIGSSGGANGRVTPRTCDIIDAMSRTRVPIVLFTRDDVDRHWREYLSKGGAFVAGDAHADDHVVIVLMREGHTDV